MEKFLPFVNFALVILSLTVTCVRFAYVQQRHGLKKVLAEKTVDAFGWFENNLHDIQTEYEANKVIMLGCSLQNC
jgi:hypothetical protein